MTDLVVFKEADKEFYLYRVAMAVTSGNGLRRKLEGMQWARPVCLVAD